MKTFLKTGVYIYVYIYLTNKEAKAEYYRTFENTREMSKTVACGSCFLNFPRVLKCPSCFITV